ncbi:CpsD/CapB family tyrosine-protein kinase [Paenibacillus swuensis]|uniref:CpsD/CapB family tyrosine-protein kinase n=1 Tax=Paenibacillus swuensis TaxID=1178515 RepID=UPI000ABEC194|nr:CpsD/CapB family tyrosine-protein kinase [Paenibacillus swuensis]
MKRNLLTFVNPQSRVSEQYRAIRNQIKFFAGEQTVRSVVITSPGIGEGKTTTAVNLAVSMALRGDRVLLVDADLSKPRLHVTFNVPNVSGLSGMLTGKLTLHEAVSHTEIHGLDVLCSGPVHGREAELIASNGVNILLHKARERYDLVMFDCPSVLTVTDTSIMANQCDGVILVINSGRTDKAAALEAKKVLERVKANVIGVVMNKHR